MQALWQEFGRHQTAELAPARPYTIDDLRTSLGRLTRDTAFANDFFRHFIEGREVPDYAALLAQAGFALQADSSATWLGASLESDTAGIHVNWTAANGPLFAAGVNNGDRILAADDRAFTDADSLDAYVQGRGPGAVLRLEVAGRDGPRTLEITLPRRPRLSIATFESAGRPVTPQIRAFRESWLGARATGAGSRD